MSLLATWRGIGDTFEGRKMVFEMGRCGARWGFWIKLLPFKEVIFNQELGMFFRCCSVVGVEVNMNVVLGGLS